MALVLQARKFLVTPGSATNLSVPLTSSWAVGAGGANYTPVTGDLVIVAFGIGFTSDVNPTKGPSGWTEPVDLYANGSTKDANLHINYKIMDGTPDTLFNYTNGTTSSQAAGIWLAEVWSGADQTTPLDVTTTTATNTGTDRPDPPSITPVTTGAIVSVFGVGASTTGAAFTQPGTELTDFLSGNSPDTTDIAGGIGHFAWTSGAFDPVAWNGGENAAGDSWCAACLAIRPSSGAGPVTHNQGFIF